MPVVELSSEYLTLGNGLSGLLIHMEGSPPRNNQWYDMSIPVLVRCQLALRMRGGRFYHLFVTKMKPPPFGGNIPNEMDSVLRGVEHA